MTTNYAAISMITPDMVRARMVSIVMRCRKALDDMNERKHRRAPQGACAMSDMSLLDTPTIPPCPDAMGPLVRGGLTITDCKPATAGSLSLWRLTNEFANPTPSELVAGIRALDAYCEQIEELARQYERDTAAAVRSHVSSQADAVRELAGLLAAK